MRENRSRQQRVEVSSILVRILFVLAKYSDANHPLTQETIIRYIYEIDGIEPNRRTISHGIRCLRTMGYEIVSTGKGTYMEERLFQPAEIVYIINLLQSSREINDICIRDLGQRVSTFAPIYDNCWNDSVTTYPNRSESTELFNNITTIRQAISMNRQVVFYYCHYGTDKKLHKSYRHIVSPMQILSNHRHEYLISYEPSVNDTRIFRIEKITDIYVSSYQRTGLDQIAYNEKELIQGKMNTESPYMYTGKTELVEFVATKNMMDHIIDWFGTDIVVEEEQDAIRVFLRVNLQSMEYWALQYVKYVEVIKPKELRNAIYMSLCDGLKKYI